MKKHFMENLESHISDEKNLSALLLKMKETGGKKGEKLFESFFDLTNKNNKTAAYDEYRQTHEKIGTTGKDISVLKEGLKVITDYMKELDPTEQHTRTLKRSLEVVSANINDGNYNSASRIIDNIVRKYKPTNVSNDNSYIDANQINQSLFIKFPTLAKELAKTKLKNSTMHEINLKSALAASANIINALAKRKSIKKNQARFYDNVDTFLKTASSSADMKKDKTKFDDFRLSFSSAEKLYANYLTGALPNSRLHPDAYKTELRKRGKVSLSLASGLFGGYNPSSFTGAAQKQRLLELMDFSFRHAAKKHLGTLFASMGYLYEKNPNLDGLFKEFANNNKKSATPLDLKTLFSVAQVDRDYLGKYNKNVSKIFNL